MPPGIAPALLPVALVMLAAALIALLAPGLWHRLDVKNSSRRQRAYASFAAEFLDSQRRLALNLALIRFDIGGMLSATGAAQKRRAVV